MATPLITGDARAHAYLAEQFRRQHDYSLFAWQQRMTKREAHSEAWRRFLAERDRQIAIQRMREHAANHIV